MVHLPGIRKHFALQKRHWIGTSSFVVLSLLVASCSSEGSGSGDPCDECSPTQICEFGICFERGTERGPADAGPDVEDTGFGFALDTSELPEVATGDPFLRIVAPEDGLLMLPGDRTMLRAEIHTGDEAPSGLQVRWSSTIDGVMQSTRVPDDGISTLEFEPDELGLRTITATVLTASSGALTDSIEVAMCDWTYEESLSAPPSPGDWERSGDALWVSDGWFELTGDRVFRVGTYRRLDARVSEEGGVVRMRMSTSSCDEPGPCTDGTLGEGFAISFVDLPSVDALRAYVEGVGGGPGLGYAVAGDYPFVTWAGDPVNMLTVEFDTSYDAGDADAGELQDPTNVSHVAVTLDGDPGAHVEWAPLDGFDDGNWHDVEVDVATGRVIVTVDDEELIRWEDESYAFGGGFLVLSAANDAVSSRHRVDDVSLLERCAEP